MPPKPTIVPNEHEDQTTEHGAPHWGIGLRNDLRSGFEGMRKEIRQQTLAGVAVALVALVLMAGLVIGSITLQAGGKNGLNVSTTASTATSTEKQP